jgi:4-diphosphocytidyl-2-C-methyl-D-erythritol kinase
MLIGRSDSVVRVHAPAKVNLFLEVLGRRADGYHDLATLMVAVSLYDTVELRAASDGAICLRCDHPDLPTGPDNLVYRAAELLRQRHGIEAGAEILLRKRIPLAAGLAGGSSDAAATLAGLNRLWRLGLGRDELAALGAEVGSDVPFFFHAPAAWCTGRGEVVEPLRLGRPLDLVLVCPAEGLSTASVFRALTPPQDRRPDSDVREAARAGDVQALGRGLFNRLQATAERLCPAVTGWHARLAGLGPAGALMSGSGTAVFALAADPAEALRIARELAAAGRGGQRARVCVVRSCV